jgi:hypothetical protein
MLRGRVMETEMLIQWQGYQDLMPGHPIQCGGNRGQHGLMKAFMLLRRMTHKCLNVEQDCQCMINGMSLPVRHSHSTSSLPSAGGRKFGRYTYYKGPSNKQNAFRRQMCLLAAPNGAVFFAAHPAHAFRNGWTLFSTNPASRPLCMSLHPLSGKPDFRKLKAPAFPFSPKVPTGNVRGNHKIEILSWRKAAWE